MPKKQRILFIATFPPPVHGSAMVSKYIKDSKIINEAFDGDYVNLSTSRRMDEIGKMKPIKIWRFLSSYFVLFWKLLKHRYALCYCAITCHGIGFLKDAPYVLLCKLFGDKVVIHQHNKGMSKDVNRVPYKWLLPLVYKNTIVILLSWHLYEDIKEIVKREQVRICPNGIPASLPNEPKAERGNAAPRILFLSNLLIEKGVFVLLDALKMLNDKGISFVCDFVGGETKEIDATKFDQELKKKGLNTLVTYHGRKYGKEKDSYFYNADVFVLPTFNECFPLVLLEAMQHKLPIVSTPVGGIPDIVKPNINGYLADQQDPIDLADKIEKLLTNNILRTTIGKNGYMIYKNNYTLEHFEKSMQSILADVIDG